MKPSTSPVRTRRATKTQADKIAAMQKQIDFLNSVIATKNALIEQYKRDTDRDADLIDLMANQIRDQQKPTTLPDQVEFAWLRQSDADCDAASKELTRYWNEGGWRIYQLDYTPTGRDVTLWRPMANPTPHRTRSAVNPTYRSVFMTGGPGVKIPVQPGMSSMVPVVVNHFEGDPEDFDAQKFNRDSDLRMAQRSLDALNSFQRSPFFRPAGFNDVRIITQ